MEYAGKILRHELKYYINKADYFEVRSRLQNTMKMDSHNSSNEGYFIRSLYFDDIYNSAMHEKISGVSMRKKYRVRIYDGSDSLIRLECKEKYDNFISKTSEKLSREQYEKLMKGDYDFLTTYNKPLFTQMYCQRKTKYLKPAAIVDYVREAYILDAGNVRVTFDKGLSGSIHNLNIFSQEVITNKILPPNIMILEVKYDDYLPSFVKGLIQIQAHNRCAISKYVLCRERFLGVKHYG